MSNIELSHIRDGFEKALERFVRSSIPVEYRSMLPQLTYHLGWEGEGAGPEAQGKRIRPMLVLVTSMANGGDWRQALPAALAVELIHNFSLIHDDIQDNSSLRRGRLTLWKKWGIAQAINAGDLMFNLAFSSLHQLSDSYPPQLVLKTSKILSDTCICLTGGQHLDLDFETRASLSMDDYWNMISGKTAALLGASCELGALCALVSMDDQKNFKEFGQQLGLAFQVWDDWLGIWGDEAVTGKSTASDLISGKKSLPVLYALGKDERFKHRWIQGAIQPDEVEDLAKWMVEDGAQAFTEANTSRLTNNAMLALDTISSMGNACFILKEMAQSLLFRKH